MTRRGGIEEAASLLKEHFEDPTLAWNKVPPTMTMMQEAFLSLMYPITATTLEHFQGVAGQRQQQRKLDPALMKALKRRDHLKRTGAAAAVTEEDARTAFKVGGDFCIASKLVIGPTLLTMANTGIALSVASGALKMLRTQILFFPLRPRETAGG